MKPKKFSPQVEKAITMCREFATLTGYTWPYFENIAEVLESDSSTEALDHMTKQKAYYEAHCDTMEGAFERERTCNSQLRERRRNLESELAYYKTELDETRGKLRLFEDGLARGMTEHSQLVAEIKQERERADQAEEDYRRVSEDRMGLESSLKDICEESSEFCKTIADLRLRLNQAEDRASAFLESSQRFEKEARDWERTCDVLTGSKGLSKFEEPFNGLGDRQPDAVNEWASKVAQKTLDSVDLSEPKEETKAEFYQRLKNFLSQEDWERVAFEFDDQEIKIQELEIQLADERKYHEMTDNLLEKCRGEIAQMVPRDLAYGYKKETEELRARFEEMSQCLAKERAAKDKPSLGACFDRLFEEARKCENFLTYNGREGEFDQWEVTVRRANGKTTAELLDIRDKTINDLMSQLQATLFDKNRLLKDVQELSDEVLRLTDALPDPVYSCSCCSAKTTDPNQPENLWHVEAGGVWTCPKCQAAATKQLNPQMCFHADTVTLSRTTDKNKILFVRPEDAEDVFS